MVITATSEREGYDDNWISTTYKKLMHNRIIEIGSSDGADVVTDYNDGDIIKITDTSVAKLTAKGNNIVVTVGKASVTLTNAVKNKVPLSISDKDGNISNYVYSNKTFMYVINNTNTTLTSVEGTDSIDWISNNVKGAIIDAKAGNDLIENYYGADDYWDDELKKWVPIKGDKTVSINGGMGNDTINNHYAADDVIIEGGDGNDIIHHYGGRSYVYNEYEGIWQTYTSVTINGGSGNDLIEIRNDNYDYWNSEGNSCIVNGGTGNDTIKNVFYFNDWTPKTIIDEGYSTIKSTYSYNKKTGVATYTTVARYVEDNGFTSTAIINGDTMTRTTVYTDEEGNFHVPDG